MSRRRRFKKQKKVVKLIRNSLLVLGLGTGFFILIVMAVFANALKELPDLEKQSTKQIAQTTKIYDINKKLITTFHAEQNRILIPLKRIPKSVKIFHPIAAKKIVRRALGIRNRNPSLAIGH